jgi:DNA polymerase-3 subunit delta'
MSIGEDFIGNRKVIGYLNKILEKGLISHAYIFDGPEHVGKTKIALEFAASLLEDRSADVRKNPDLIFVGLSENKDEMVADNIRDLQKSLSLYPYNSKRKVAIIDKAHLMNKTAANSLLKILEEPNQTSVLILLSSDLDKILETIKSRCQVLSFGVVNGRLIKESLSIEGEEALKILDISLGRPGIAITLSENPELLNRMVGYINILKSFEAGDNFQRIQESEKLYSLERDEINRILDIFTFTLRGKMLENISQGVATDRVEREKNKIELINKTKTDINENNANLKLAIENLYLNL